MKETLLIGSTLAFFLHLLAAKLIQITPLSPAEGEPLSSVSTVALIAPPPPNFRYFPKRPRIEPDLIKRTERALTLGEEND